MHAFYTTLQPCPLHTEAGSTLCNRYPVVPLLGCSSQQQWHPVSGYKRGELALSHGILDSYRREKGLTVENTESLPAQQLSTTKDKRQQGGDSDDECEAECVREVFSKEDFDAAVHGASQNTLVVCDFYKTACGSCRYIQPGFVKLCEASKHDDGAPAVVFLKHNVMDEYDEESELADSLNIKVVPQFHFYKGGDLVESFATREKNRVGEAINKFAGEGTVDLASLSNIHNH